jgi:hypothetical protein
MMSTSSLGVRLRKLPSPPLAVRATAKNARLTSEDPRELHQAPSYRRQETPNASSKHHCTRAKRTELVANTGIPHAECQGPHSPKGPRASTSLLHALRSWKTKTTPEQRLSVTGRVLAKLQKTVPGGITSNRVAAQQLPTTNA